MDAKGSVTDGPHETCAADVTGAVATQEKAINLKDDVRNGAVRADQRVSWPSQHCPPVMVGRALL